MLENLACILFLALQPKELAPWLPFGVYKTCSFGLNVKPILTPMGGDRRISVKNVLRDSDDPLAQGYLRKLREKGIEDVDI